VVRLEDVCKWFGAFQALAEVSFSVDAGTFLTILGPSGSGKTTSLRIIGGFESPDRGAVYLDGHDITDVPPYRRDINTTFQGYALFPHMTVFQNVAFGLETKGLAKRAIEERVTEALGLVKLDGFAPRPIQGLSGGEQQRVALARAFVNRPKVLLLDEPLGALDLKLRRAMQIELKKLQRALGITFVYVTHDQEEALSMSDKIVVMNRGRIEQIGAPGDIYRQPLTSFVADFLGEANILEGRITAQNDGRLSVEVAGRPVSATAGALQGLSVGQMVLLSLRAESVSLGRVSDDLTNRFEGVVGDAIFLGTAWEYVVAIGTDLTLKCWTASSRNQKPFVPGQTVAVGWAPDDIVAVQ
jgi:spermidine/putrescine transport system ATP-binding protein